MAIRVSIGTGNWSDDTKWATGIAPIATVSTTAFTTVSGTNSPSSDITGTGTNCIGAMVLLNRLPVGTGNVVFTLLEGATDRANVTIPISDFHDYTNVNAALPVIGQQTYIFIKWDTPYAWSATTYTVNVKTTGSVTVAPRFAANASAKLHAMAVNDTAVAPVTGDPVYILGSNCVNTNTITIDGARACGNSGATSGIALISSLNDLTVGEGGVLLGDSSQASTLTIDGNMIVVNGGTFKAFNTGTSVPEAYPFRLIFTQGASVDHGWYFSSATTVDMTGASRTPFGKWVSGDGTAASRLVVDRDTDWAVGDQLEFTATGDSIYNWTEFENATIANKIDARTFDLDFGERVFNGNLEFGTTAFTGWTLTGGTGGGAFIVETSLVHAGTRAAKGTYVSGTPATMYFTPIYCPPDQTMALNFWTRGDGTREMRYRIYDVTNSVDIVALKGSGVTGTSYTQVTENFTVPSTCYQVRVYFYAPVTAGSAYIDDVSVKSTKLSAKNEHCYVVNTQSNSSIEGTSYLLQTYGITDGVAGEHKFSYTKMKYHGSSSSQKYGVYLGYTGTATTSNFNYVRLEDCAFYGMYSYTSKKPETWTGLVAYNTLSTNLGLSISYGISITAQTGTTPINKTLTDCFVIGINRNPIISGGVSVVMNNFVSNCCGLNGNVYAGLQITGGTYITLNTPEINASRGPGYYLSGGSNMVVNNGQIGTYGKNGLTYGDVAIAPDSSHQILFDTCYFGSDTFITGYTDALSFAYTAFQNLNGVANNHEWYESHGIGRSTGAGLVDTLVRTTGGLALRIAPENSTDGSFNWQSDIPTGNIQNKDMQVGVWVYINSANYWAGTYTMPTLSVNYDNGTIVTCVASQTAGSWQFLHIPFKPTTTYPTITVNLLVTTDATGTDSYIYVDDWSTLYPAGYIMNLGSLDTWAKGMPATPLISTLFSAQDIWTVGTTTMGTGSIGAFVLKLKNWINNIGLIKRL